MNNDSEVLLEVRGGIGLITLNKPKALNSLNLAMIEVLSPQLDAWAVDDAVRAVVIRGAGDRAFCAGGDIRAMYEGRGTDAGPNFFGAEYKLNIAIHNYPKPYVALMDGITMGGGVGLSVHGTHRVLTERTLFAMPETGIGLFPDIGASWILPRCPGELGMYLGLTGYRCKTADTLYAGIGDVSVASERLDELVDALAAADDLSATGIDKLISGFAAEGEPAPLAAHREEIDRCFAGDSVEDILAHLEAEGSEWAAETAATIARMSPTSLKVTFRELREGRTLERIEDIMRMEYRIAHRSFRGHDLFEGIRAVVIDKDGKPDWQPKELSAVSEADVAEYFAPAPGEPDFG